MTNKALSAAASVLLAGVAGCEISTPDLADEGTVRLVDVEGGCWGIESEGQLYEPINLPESMRVDSLPVSFVAMERKDIGSFCMIGPVIELLRVQTRESISEASSLYAGR